MFYNCTSLTSINFNLQPSTTITIYELVEMFSYCESLTSIDLSKFNIYNEMTNTRGMFTGCRSLTSLDLTSFSGSNLQYGQYMFYDCPNLIYVKYPNSHYCNHGCNENDIYNFVFLKNIVFCCDRCSFMNGYIDRFGCARRDCSSNWRQYQLKLNLENNTCVRDCSLTTNNHYLYLAKCYDSCPNGTYTNNDDLTCGDCHPDCKTCERPPEAGNANCKSCKSKYKYLKSGNCIYDCAEEIPFELITYQICVKYCPIQELLDKECILAYQSDDENKLYDIMIGNINYGFTSEQYDIEHLESGGEDIIEYGKMTVKLTTSENEKNNLNINSTIIDLKDCENI